MPHGLDKDEHAVKHQGHDAHEGQLRTGEDRPRRGHGEVGQHERQRSQRRQHGQGGTRALYLEALGVVPYSAGQQAHSDNAVAHQHYRREHRVPRQRRLLRAATQHHGYDQRHLDHRHGDGQHQRAERLSNPVRHQLGVIDGGEHGGDQHHGRAGREQGAHPCEQRPGQQRPRGERPKPGPPRHPRCSHDSGPLCSPAHPNAGS